MDRRQFIAATGAAGVLPFLKAMPAGAQGRDDTLVAVTGFGPNSMDIMRVGANRPAYQPAINLYDRLMRYGIRELPDGTLAYDKEVLEPELAESWTMADDGMSVDFFLRRDATFWDGTPVTAEDVKWSFDRAVLLGGFATVQMRAGGFTDADQWEVVDEHVFRVHFNAPSKLSMPNLAVPTAIVYNSALCKANATDADPWASDFTHVTPAGGGAFKLERWDSGQQSVYIRNDDWKSGPLPGVRRVIVREVPSAATRRALLERGDAQFSIDMPAKDAMELNENPRVKVEGHPIGCCQHHVGMNVAMAPFDNVLVRRAIAYALPYESIYNLAAFGRGEKLWGGEGFEPAEAVWPLPSPYYTDVEKAKALLAEAGMPDGFETTLSINLGLADWQEPAAVLIQEALAEIGVRVTIDRIPGANWRTAALIEKRLPFHLENFGGWLDYPDYYFFWVYQTGRLFNSVNYSDPMVDEVTDMVLPLETDHPDWAPNVKKLIAKVWEDVPLAPLYQPYLDMGMAPRVEGYAYHFHRLLDAKTLTMA
ncbi:MAG: ABC transporter substrate-binding protein [Rhodobacteraceae bacterium]|nr:MAG: ABC transporter substrate-binding protein [Paracoccaceae bacterium]